MSFVILQTFTAKDGQYAPLAEIISRMLVDTAAREGAEFVHAAGNPAAGSIVVYQQWASAESQKAYTDWRMQQSNLGEMIALLAAPPKIEQLTKLF